MPKYAVILYRLWYILNSLPLYQERKETSIEDFVWNEHVMEMGGSLSLNILIHIWNQVHVHTYIIVCERKKVNKTKCLVKLFRYIQIYLYKLVHFIEINIYLAMMMMVIMMMSRWLATNQNQIKTLMLMLKMCVSHKKGH